MKTDFNMTLFICTVLQTYADLDDLFSDNSIKSHVYSTMEKFVLECFGHPREDELAVVEEVEE